MTTARALGIYTLLWFGLLAFAVLNGGVRDFVYGKGLDASTAHQISTLALCVVIVVYTWLAHRIWPIASAALALVIGLLWMLLTVAFETWMILSVMEEDFTVVLQSYDLTRGQLWPLVLVCTGVAPWLVRRIGQHRAGA
ncbi:MAG: hypothetical protein JSW10_04285 [Pseudomonadota bacterium]|nr:MAG: hypothetical protein JSW10_04285 [Pseudomonadota bacterium]